MDDSAMDELHRFRNAVLAVATAAVTLWLINDWALTLEILTDPSLWLHSLMAPRPEYPTGIGVWLLTWPPDEMFVTP